MKSITFFAGLRTAIGVCVALAVFALAGCASPPVQEMSNARQAIHAAQAAGAPQQAPRIYAEAVHWMNDAENALEHKNYSRARSSALQAEDAARAATLAARKVQPAAPATSVPAAGTHSGPSGAAHSFVSA